MCTPTEEERKDSKNNKAIPQTMGKNVSFVVSNTKISIQWKSMWIQNIKTKINQYSKIYLTSDHKTIMNTISCEVR